MFKRSYTMQFLHLLMFMTLFVICLADMSDLLKNTKNSINRATKLYSKYVEDESRCRKKEMSLDFLDVAINIMSEVKNNYPSCPDPECPKCVERPMDCSEILLSGKNKSGFYTIWPRNRISSNKQLAVYCDMDTDGGGWTVIQRRGNFSKPKDYFFRNWNSYKRGFGYITEDFWLGNDNIFAISNQANYSIRFDLEDAEGNQKYAEYQTFWIDDEAANYTLHVKGYSGNAGDSMSTDNEAKFATKDRDNGYYVSNCALLRKGGWWYTACSFANLNGFYQPGVSSLEVVSWKDRLPLSSVEIKLRNVNNR